MPATGPTTEAGKAASSRNAVKHGLLSEAPVVTCLESQEDWQDHREAVLEDLLGSARPDAEPARGSGLPSSDFRLRTSVGGQMQLCLAERAALLNWRLRRIACAEADSVNAGLEALQLDEKLTLARDTAQFHQGLNELARGILDLPAEQPVENRLARALINYTLELKGSDLACGNLPGMGAKRDWDFQDFSVGQVREAYRHIAERRGQDERLLQRELVWYCEANGKSPLQRYQELALKRDHLARARSLPDEKRLETLTRYEAHLGRELTHTLKSLRDLQARPAAAPQSQISNLQTPISDSDRLRERTLNGSTPIQIDATENYQTIPDGSCSQTPSLQYSATPENQNSVSRTETVIAPMLENCETNSVSLEESPEMSSLQYCAPPAPQLRVPQVRGAPASEENPSVPAPPGYYWSFERRCFRPLPTRP